MSLVKLINEIGVDNIEYQTLHSSLVNAKQEGRNTELTFLTDQITTTDLALGAGKKAIIIWVDSDVLSAACDKVSE
ncbi:MAG: hypothetical protein GY799_33145 [Desulfobulbaceae bacterium]|nr:hypothetical protein [Desulfobulbaceae bacterium]